MIRGPAEHLGSITLCSKLRSQRHSRWQCPGRFLGILGRYSSVHTGDMWTSFGFSLIELGYIL